MAFITDSLILDLEIILIPIIYFIYAYFTLTFNYWKDRGIRYVKPIIFFGNLKDAVLGRKSVIDIYESMYKELEGERFGGFFEFSTPSLLIRDPALIERVLIKDFLYFHDRGLTLLDDREPISKNLANLEGQEWRNLRYKLIPAFTTGKLKAMFQQICNCGQDLLKEIEQCSAKGEVVEAKYLTDLYIIDVVASCAFGLQFKSNTTDGSLYRKMVEKFVAPSQVNLLQVIMILFNKNVAKFFGLRSVPKDVSNYFINICKATVKYREENKITRNDFLQLLMTLRDQELSGKEINLAAEVSDEDTVINQLEYTAADKEALKNAKVFTEESIAAQSFVFLTAGSETSSGSLSCALYALGTNPEAQTRLQQEVDSMMDKHKQWTYQAIKDMIYLEHVIQETLRMYPIGGLLTRKCVIPYKIPGTEIVLEKGLRISIPVYSLHKDPQYYPQPDVFDPDRFLDNIIEPTSQPRPYLPFGDGRRMCIGLRFTILQMKVGIARIMAEYSITLSDKTQTPIQWDPKTLVLRFAGGVWLRFHRRSKI